LDLAHITKAAIQAGYAEKAAAQQGSRLLKNVKIQDYLAERRNERKEAVHLTLSTYAEKVVNELYELAMNAESENVRMQAIKDIMDRSGFKPIEKVDNKTELGGKIEFGFRDPNEDK
jgi:phage terminase small subunit